MKPDVEYVLRIADNALIHAQRLAEWCGHAPILEEDIALTNMALDLLGQARALLTHAGALEGLGHDEDQLAFLRDEREYRNVTLVELPLKRGGGLITREDLAAYRARQRPPVHGTYRGYDVYGPPPPSSGGTCLVEMLNVLENFDLKKRGRFSADTLHLMAETMRRAYCDRARYLGDADFVKVPVAGLISRAYADERRKDIDPMHATDSKAVSDANPIPYESPQTTHFTVVDGNGSDR